MNALIVAAIILLATLENSAPFVLGLLKTPPGFVFLGTVHHPADYFYYLSQFAQGAQRWAESVDLYTTEAIGASFVGWSNVLLGRIFHLVGASPFIAYHVGVIVLSVLLLFLSYRVALVILGKTFPATLTLFFFVLFHAFPVTREGISSYADYWNNYAVPSVRFGGVPHQLLIGVASMLCMLLLVRIARGGAGSRVITGLIVASATLASLQPVLWALFLAALAVTEGVLFIKTHKIDTWGILAVFLGGIAPALYLSQRFLVPPFLQLKLWEAAQQTTLTPQHFLTATGPIFLLALFFVPRFVSKTSFSRVFIVLFSLSSFILFLSPLPALFGVSHVRFMSSFTIFCISLIAAWGTFQLLAAKTKTRKLIGIAIILLLSVLLIPNHFKTIKLHSANDSTNAYYYLPKGDYALLRKAAAVSTPNDAFLVVWPYNVVFPGVTGRKSFNGHPLLTIQSEEKNRATDAFFARNMNDRAMQDLLRTHQISFVIAYPINPLPSFLAPVYAEGSLILYKVAR
jgi:hypothetical protein